MKEDVLATCLVVQNSWQRQLKEGLVEAYSSRGYSSSWQERLQ